MIIWPPTDELSYTTPRDLPPPDEDDLLEH
jgi:hypothetical protein